LPVSAAHRSNTSNCPWARPGWNLSTAARILNSLAEIASSTGATRINEAGWQRRNDEWVHQTQVLTIEIQQLERLILGAHAGGTRPWWISTCKQRQMEQITEVENFLRDKFTAHNLYLFFKRKRRACIRACMTSPCARRTRPKAPSIRGGPHHAPLPGWLYLDSLHEGLMAGERLDLALQRMEHAYMDLNFGNMSSPNTSRSGCTSRWNTCGCA